MRVGISTNSRNVEKIVEFSAMTFGSVDSFAEPMLDDYVKVKENNIERHNYIAEDLANELNDLLYCANSMSTTIVCYNKDTVSSIKFPVDVDGEYSGHDGVIQSIRDIESCESQDLTVRYMGEILTDKEPECCVVTFDTVEDTNKILKKALVDGYIDTSSANVIVLLYKDLPVKYDKADYYVVAYKLKDREV